MSSQPTFRRVSAGVDFPALENDILELWDQIDAFAASVLMRPADRDYVFYDGPPFPTGSPHYGNLLAGVVKDMVPRYWTMRGHRVERRFGWDTHGLPIEMEVEKQLGISGPKQIAEFGIGAFNEACRAQVQANTENWERITRRIGRWVDFNNDYKTMDAGFMESVWWVFARLWEQDLVYKAFKVLPYSWGATTPLSNFEVNLGGYRDVDDPSITLRLEILDGAGPVRPGDHLLIWTTTPWTLPGNLAVAVGEDIDYVRIDHEGHRYWIAASRVDAYWPDPPDPADTATGSDMLGAGYRPPFDHFGEERDRGAFRIIPSDDVTTEDGTGLVHMAPAYGEADFYALQAAGLDVLVDPVDLGGNFTDAVPEVAGMNIKEADKVLIGLLKDTGILVRNERIRHSYPFCYRTDTPLIYKAIPTWFVRVESIKERMVELNRHIHWVPAYVGERRFGNWLDDARDWAISRNRYWGSCIPVWECDSCDHSECVGSVDRLEELSGIRPDDLHKHVIDPIAFPCTQAGCTGTMTRVPEVLDCWFESGSMPYGQVHYPFENRERFEAGFPAQFIAEGLDQTRGWYYTLHILATALFDEPAFLNCVTNGLILAQDGRKMSKSLKNYPDPFEVFDTFGADALRAFLINSPVLRAEPLRFSEDGVRDVVRTVLLPLWNTFSFFTTYAEADGITLDDLSAAPGHDHRPEIDRWILSVLQSLIDDVNRQMQGYYLYDVIPPTLAFIDDLTNWYVRRSRRRFWRTRTGDDADKLAAFATLYEVLVTFVKVLAPVLPFVTERLYQELVIAPTENGAEQPASVHHCDFPDADPRLIDHNLEELMETVRLVTRLGHGLRKQSQIKVRQPLGALTVFTADEQAAGAVRVHHDILAEELNVKTISVHRDETELVDLAAKIDYSRLGPRLGKKTPIVAAAVQQLGKTSIERLIQGKSIEVEGETLGLDDILIQRIPRAGVAVASDGGVTVAIDTELDDDLMAEGWAREFVSRVQQIRRERELAVTDRIRVTWHTGDEGLAAAITRHSDWISQEILATSFSRSESGDTYEIDGRTLTISIDRV